MKLHGTMRIENNQLIIGDVPVSRLAEQYQTPLYIFDEADFIHRAQLFLQKFRSDLFKTTIYYAAKTFCNLYILGLVEKLGLAVDVVSEGELYTAVQAGVDPANINLHGNNKLPRELAMALAEKAGRITVDHGSEFRQLEKICQEKRQTAEVLLRINPGIEADTHKYIQTTKEDSKFGMSVEDPRTFELLQAMRDSSFVHLRGVHCHIGSQILNKKFFFEEAEAMFDFVKKLRDEYRIELTEINLGGGFGVYYTAEDRPFDPAEFLAEYIAVIERRILKDHLAIKRVSIEPGRSLINDSGSILYTVGAVKYPLQGKPFVFVDGGMTDNIRPALYQAKYEAALANRMEDAADDHYRIAGKCCETGDVLVENALLPEAEAGDLLLIPAAGAYTYAMSSNYNRLPKPAVVFVKNGESRLAVKRESYEDLIRNDCFYQK